MKSTPWCVTLILEKSAGVRGGKRFEQSSFNLQVGRSLEVMIQVLYQREHWPNKVYLQTLNSQLVASLLGDWVSSYFCGFFTHKHTHTGDTWLLIKASCCWLYPINTCVESCMMTEVTWKKQQDCNYRRWQAWYRWISTFLVLFKSLFSKKVKWGSVYWLFVED